MKSHHETRIKLGDGRQYGDRLEQIKRNHVIRYQWAADQFGKAFVVDAGCGCGYGSSILAGKAQRVLGLEFNRHVVEFAQVHWKKSNIEFMEWDLAKGFPDLSFAVDYTVCFEVIEHLACPQLFLGDLPLGMTIIGSVPGVSSTIASNPFHIGNYNRKSILRLLEDCGFQLTWSGSQDFDEVRDDLNGRTIVFVAEKRNEGCDLKPLREQYPSLLLYHFLRRCNVISDMKNKRDHLKPETAF